MIWGGRTRCHGNQSLSSPSSAFSRFSRFLRLWRSSSSVLTTGCIPLLPRARALCLFPKRPMGLTPRPTYQNGSISGPGGHKYSRHYISKQAFKYNDVETKITNTNDIMMMAIFCSRLLNINDDMKHSSVKHMDIFSIFSLIIQVFNTDSDASKYSIWRIFIWMRIKGILMITRTLLSYLLQFFF